MEEKYILSLDIGTTTIRSFIYNSRAEIVNKAINEASTNNNNVMFLFVAGFYVILLPCIYKK